MGGKRVKKLKPHFAAAVGRTLIKNEIVEEEEWLVRYNLAFGRVWHLVGDFLSLTDWLRFNKLLGETGYRLHQKLRTQYSGRLEWLRTRRFGSEELNFDAVFNLSSVNLSRTQLEI